jgi:Domain of Unknown Function (DUF1080)
MTITRIDHALHTLFVHSQPTHAEPRHLKPLSVPLVFLVGFLLFSLGACSAGTSSTSVPPQTTIPAARHSSPTPTPLQAGTVLYQADWSHGLTGWPGAQGWKVVQGQLESDSSSSATFTIPYHLFVSDYAIEIRLEIVRLLSQNGGSSFTIFATKSPGKDGYQAGVSNLLGSGPHPMAAHPQSQVFLDPYDDTSPGTGLPNAYYPRAGWHTYRVEVQGSEAILLVDGQQISSASSQQTGVLSNGPLGLSSQLVVLRVSNVRILTL